MSDLRGYQFQGQRAGVLCVQRIQEAQVVSVVWMQCVVVNEAACAINDGTRVVHLDGLHVVGAVAEDGGSTGIDEFVCQILDAPDSRR